MPRRHPNKRRAPPPTTPNLGSGTPSIDGGSEIASPAVDTSKSHPPKRSAVSRQSKAEDLPHVLSTLSAAPVPSVPPKPKQRSFPASDSDPPSTALMPQKLVAHVTPTPAPAPLKKAIQAAASASKSKADEWLTPHPFMRNDDSNGAHTFYWFCLASMAFPSDLMFIGSLLLTELWLAHEILPRELWISLRYVAREFLMYRANKAHPRTVTQVLLEKTISGLWAFLRTVRLPQLDRACKKAGFEVVIQSPPKDSQLPKEQVIDRPFSRLADRAKIVRRGLREYADERGSGKENPNIAPPFEGAQLGVSWLIYYGARGVMSCTATSSDETCVCPHHVRLQGGSSFSSPACSKIALDDHFNLARSRASQFLQQDPGQLFVFDSQSFSILNASGQQLLQDLAGTEIADKALSTVPNKASLVAVSKLYESPEVSAMGPDTVKTGTMPWQSQEHDDDDDDRSKLVPVHFITFSSPQLDFSQATSCPLIEPASCKFPLADDVVERLYNLPKTVECPEDSLTMWMQSAVQNCAVVLGRDTAFSQLKAAWIIFLESNLSNKMHKDMIPQRYMFVWEGQILKMDETPESVGMGQAGPLEPIAVLDAADVWYGIGTHEPEFVHDVTRATNIRRVLGKMDHDKDPELTAQLDQTAYLVRQTSACLEVVDQSADDKSDSLGRWASSLKDSVMAFWK